MYDYQALVVAMAVELKQRPVEVDKSTFVGNHFVFFK